MPRLTESHINTVDFLHKLGGKRGLHNRQHWRAGITTNKGRGQSKVRRKMAKASRRRNRA